MKNENILYFGEISETTNFKQNWIRQPLRDIIKEGIIWNLKKEKEKNRE